MPHQVKRLDLDLVNNYTQRNCYKFPNVCDPIQRCRIFPIGLSCFGDLVKLRLSKVGISGEALALVIANSPLLEELCLEFSQCIRRLINSQPLMRLRLVEIRDCPLLRTVEICSPDLRRLKLSCLDEKLSTSLKNVSSLTNLFLGDSVFNNVASSLVGISGCLSRLETLTIHISHLEVRRPLPNLPHFPMLKKLVLIVRAYGIESLLCFTSLLDAAPMLREFILKSNVFIPRDRAIIDSTKGQPHECLEVLQIVGFGGSDIEVGLAEYVIQNAVSLKKVIIDCCQRLRGREALEIDKLTKEGVRQLQAKLSEGVDLIVYR